MNPQQEIFNIKSGGYRFQLPESGDFTNGTIIEDPLTGTQYQAIHSTPDVKEAEKHHKRAKFLHILNLVFVACGISGILFLALICVMHFVDTGQLDFVSLVTNFPTAIAICLFGFVATLICSAIVTNLENREKRREKQSSKWSYFWQEYAEQKPADFGFETETNLANGMPKAN